MNYNHILDPNLKEEVSSSEKDYNAGVFKESFAINIEQNIMKGSKLVSPAKVKSKF